MGLLRHFGPGKIGNLIALIAGAILPLSFAPFELWPIGIISIALYALSHHKLTAKQAVWRGWFYGVGMYGAGASWVYVSIHVHGYAPVPLALFLTMLWCGGLAFFISINSYVYAKFLRDRPLGLLLGFPAAWVLNEWFRLWFLTGFPWLYLGYAHQTTWLSGWAPLLGVMGISFFVALSASILCTLLINYTSISIRQKSTYLSVIALVWLAGLGLAQISWVTPKGNPVNVALVQANVPQEQKWNQTYRKMILQRYREMTDEVWDSDIIVWPETAVPLVYEDPRAKKYFNYFAAKAKENNASLISGIAFFAESGSGYYNGIVAFDSEEKKYYKRHLVPFGEYVPLENILRGLIQFFDLPMSQFVPGPQKQAPLSATGLKISPFICYEIVYPNMVANGALVSDLLLTISNDSWFGQSIGPIQHLQIAQMRALENGRYLIRGTNNGITAIIDERGNIQNRGEQFVQVTVMGKAFAMTGTTPFSALGIWPIIALCFGLCIFTYLFPQKDSLKRSD